MKEDEKQKLEKLFIDSYDKYADLIFRYCYYRVFDREKAKDLVQEAYCRAWKYMNDGNTIENIKSFLYKIARNIIIDDSRKKKAHSLDSMMEKGFAPSADDREKTLDIFSGKEILPVIESLDEKYRDVIKLKYLQDLSTKEIAKILGETENNIYVRTSRGFKKLKEILKLRGFS